MTTAEAMSVGPDESELLITFARAASKAQEVEALLQDRLTCNYVENPSPYQDFFP